VSAARSGFQRRTTAALWFAVVGRILVVDDEPRIVSFVSRVLAAEGYGVDTVGDGPTALRTAMTGIYDLVVLDLLLPGLDGTAVLAELTEARPHQPVLVLSAVSGVEDRVRCLRLGASDYVVKPFAISELVARVHALLRARGRPDADEVRSIGGIALDRRTRRADAGHGPVHLSEKEFLLLLHLMDRSPEVCLREELLADVWGLPFRPGSNVVDVCVGRLRQKLGNDAVETVRSLGYRCVGP
jgi:two-component system, OmpR family, response regulator